MPAPASARRHRPAAGRPAAQRPPGRSGSGRCVGAPRGAAQRRSPRSSWQGSPGAACSRARRATPSSISAPGRCATAISRLSSGVGFLEAAHEILVNLSEQLFLAVEQLRDAAEGLLEDHPLSLHLRSGEADLGIWNCGHRARGGGGPGTSSSTITRGEHPSQEDLPGSGAGLGCQVRLERAGCRRSSDKRGCQGGG